MNRTFLVTSAVGLVLALSGAAEANLIGNPSFVSTGGQATHDQGGGINDWAGITRWYEATGGTWYLPHTGETYSDAKWTMQAAGTNAPTATQKIPTVTFDMGDTFDFSFWTTSTNGAGNMGGRLEIGYNAGSGFVVVASVTGAANQSLTWLNYSGSYVVDGSMGELGQAMEVHMVTLNPSNTATSWIDDVELLETPGPVPEPATMSLLVLGGLAALIRRRRR